MAARVAYSARWSRSRSHAEVVGDDDDRHVEEDPRPKRSREDWATLIGLSVVVALGVTVRVPALTDTGLWRDDAWTALASRVSLGTAVRMSTTTPGFTLAERAWIGLDPGSSLWAQLLPLLYGIGGVVAVFSLVRYWGLSRWLALTAAFVVAVSPVATQYSTHTKQYSTDMLLACLVLWRGEAARRSATTRPLVALSVVSGATILVSASVTPVIAGVWVAVLVCNARSVHAIRALRRIAVSGAPLVVFLGGVYFVLLRNLPTVLHRYWLSSGAFLDKSSVGAFWHSLTFAVSVVTVGLVAPAGRLDVYGDPIWHSGRVFWPAVALVVLVLAGGTARGRAATAGLPLVAAFAASFIGAAPLGTGRTDEVLYPAVIVMAALGVDQIVRFAAGLKILGHVARRIGIGVLVAALGGFLAAALLSSTVRHPPRYPEIDIRGLASYLAQQRQPADWVLVDPYSRYPWTLYEAKHVTVEIGRGWGAGFTVASDQPNVFISPSEPWEDGYEPATWAAKVADAGRLWYLGTWYLSRADDPVYQALLAQGWIPEKEFDTTGGFVVLMTGGGTSAPTLLQQGVAAQNGGHTAVAIARYRAVMAKDPRNVYAPYDLGVIDQQAGNITAASTAYRQALAGDPTYKPALFNLAILATPTDPTQAIALYDQLLRLESGDPDVNFNLGLLLVSQGQTAAGRADIQKALKLDPSLTTRVPAGTLP